VELRQCLIVIMNDGGLCACSVVYNDFRCNRVRVQLLFIIVGGIEVVFSSL
jgi:hypothetical protein